MTQDNKFIILDDDDDDNEIDLTASPPKSKSNDNTKLEMDEILRLFLTCSYSAFGILQNDHKKSNNKTKINLLKRNNKNARKPKRRQRKDDDDDDEEEKEEETTSSENSDEENNNINGMKATWVEDELERIRTVASQNLENSFLNKQSSSKKKNKQQEKQHEESNRINGLWKWNLKIFQSSTENRTDKSVEELTRIVSENNKVSDLALTQEDYQSWIDAFAWWLSENIVNENDLEQNTSRNKPKSAAAKEKRKNESSGIFETRAQILMMTMMQVSFEDVEACSLQDCIDCLVGSVFCLVDPKQKQFALLPKPEVVELDSDDE